MENYIQIKHLLRIKIFCFKKFYDHFPCSFCFPLHRTSCSKCLMYNRSFVYILIRCILRFYVYVFSICKKCFALAFLLLLCFILTQCFQDLEMFLLHLGWGSQFPRCVIVSHVKPELARYMTSRMQEIGHWMTSEIRSKTATASARLFLSWASEPRNRGRRGHVYIPVTNPRQV